MENDKRMSNKEYHKKYYAEWYKIHRAERLKYQKQYYLDNFERKSAYSKERYAKKKLEEQGKGETKNER